MLVVSPATDLETEVFGSFGVAVAAEVLVDSVLVFAGTDLREEVSIHNFARTSSTCMCCLRAVLLIAWTMNLDVSQCRRDKGKNEE